MNAFEPVKKIPTREYQGEGCQGWYVLDDAGHRLYDELELQPGRPFGGDLTANQVWEFLDGYGRVSVDERMLREMHYPGSHVDLRAGERALVIAITAVRLRIRFSRPELPANLQRLLPIARID